MASNGGTWFQIVAAGWLIFDETGSAAMVGALALATRAPSVLLAPAAGQLADRFDRRRVGIAANLIQAAAAAALAVLAAAGLAGAWVILGLTFALGCGFALGLPAQLALIPFLAPAERLSQAVALNSVGINVARLAGPAVGGLLLASVGATACFALNAVSFAAVVVALMVVRPRAAPPRQGSSTIRTGLDHARRDPAIRRLLIGMAVFTGMASSIQELAPVIAENVGAGPTGLGLLLGAMGGGGVLGAWLLERLVGRGLRRGVALPAATGVFALFMAVLAAAPTLPFAIVAMAACGSMWIWMFSGTNTAIQLRAPSRLVGRMLGLYQLAVIAPIGVGSLALGALAGVLGIAPALWSAAAVLGAWSIYALRNPVAEIDRPPGDGGP